MQLEFFESQNQWKRKMISNIFTNKTSFYFSEPYEVQRPYPVQVPVDKPYPVQVPVPTVSLNFNTHFLFGYDSKKEIFYDDNVVIKITLQWSH